MKRQPTEEQRAAARERRTRMRALARRIADMDEGQRQALVGGGIATIEGHSLSVTNTCMILLQNPGATVVGGFQQWRNRGRCVRKGEKGLAIWFPIGNGAEAAADHPADDAEGVRFGLGTVFDVAQTDAIEADASPRPTATPQAPMAPKSNTNPKLVARLNGQADTIARKIADLRADRLSNTPKRAYQAMAARCDANNLERVERALVALAGAWEAGTVPAGLRSLETRADIEPLVTRIIDHPSYYVAQESDKWRSDTEQARELRAWVARIENGRHAEADAEKARADRVRAIEDDLRFRPIEGFFPTPPALVERMIEAADLCPGLKCLEPSAGKGDIAEAIEAAGCDCVGFEIVPRLVEACKAKGLSVECADFCAMVPVAGFDRVLMNPPFERGQDMEHVRRALAWLKPGGRLVAIMSPSFTFHRAAESFRAWLEELGATWEENDPEAFKGAFRQTSVRTMLVTINKPASVASEPAAELIGGAA